jgi:REP element-mobilizing transposase RayT
VTVCIHDRKQRLLGNVIDGKFIDNEFSEIIRSNWHDLPNKYRHIQLDEFIIMPNHVHGIIVIRGLSNVVVGAGSPRPVESGSPRPVDHIPVNDDFEHQETGRDHRAPTLGNMVAFFKYQTTKQINACRNSGIRKIWQRNYYDHIIRDEKSLYFIRKYIRDNPANWGNDIENHIDKEIALFSPRIARSE